MKRTLWLMMAMTLMVTGAVFAGGKKETQDTKAESPGSVESTTGAAVKSEKISVDDAVARVNGRMIGRAEFEKVVESNIQRYEAQSQQQFDEQLRPRLQRQVLDGLITRAVLEQEAQDEAITVSDERVAETLGQFMGQFPNESAYLMALEQEGFTEDEFVGELRRQLVIEELIRTKVYDGITVSDEEMRTFYANNPQYFEQPAQVAARHIILTTEGITDESVLAAKRADLERIRQDILNGADFGEVARERSEGPTAPNGGDLGSFARGQMVPEFEAVAFSLEPGELSDIVETQFGYHILEVTKKVPARTETFEEARENIRIFLTEQEQNTAAQGYITDLREAADVVELIEIDAPNPGQM